jgi:hypothetical protein
MWIRRSKFEELSRAAGAVDGMKAEVQRARADVANVRREMTNLMSEVVRMKREGMVAGPPQDEVFGRYSIAEEERRRLEQTAPPRSPRPVLDDDLIDFEQEVIAAIGED